jgi:hypothetical protein
MAIVLTTGTSTLRQFIVTVMTRYTGDFTHAPRGEVLMTRVRSTEEPCAAKVARTVLKTSGGSDPLAEFNRALRPAVIARKVSHCSKNDAGAHAFEAFTSVVRTLAEQGLDSLVENLYHLFQLPSIQGVFP